MFKIYDEPESPNEGAGLRNGGTSTASVVELDHVASAHHTAVVARQAKFRTRIYTAHHMYTYQALQKQITRTKIEHHAAVPVVDVGSYFSKTLLMAA